MSEDADGKRGPYGVGEKRMERFAYVVEQLETTRRISRVVKRTAKKFGISDRQARRDVEDCFADWAAQRGPAKLVDYERTETAFEHLAEQANIGHRKSIQMFDDHREGDVDAAVKALAAGARYISAGVAAQDKLARLRKIYSDKPATRDDRPVLGLRDMKAMRERLEELRKRRLEVEAKEARDGREREELDS